MKTEKKKYIVPQAITVTLKHDVLMTNTSTNSPTDDLGDGVADSRNGGLWDDDVQDQW